MDLLWQNKITFLSSPNGMLQLQNIHSKMDHQGNMLDAICGTKYKLTERSLNDS